MAPLQVNAGRDDLGGSVAFMRLLGETSPG
jgi:hypothetical protein